MKERNWATKVYAHPKHTERLTNPYICRMAVESHAFTIEWVDLGSDCSHSLHIKPRFEENAEFQIFPLTEGTMRFDGFENAVDYEIYVVRDDGSAKSDKRYVNMCDVPGVVVNYAHPNDGYYANSSGCFLGSPHFVRLPSGRLLLSHDIHNGPIGEGHVIILASDDDGKTWKHLTEIFPLFWCKLFVHNERLYIMGPYGAYGDLVISESKDEGLTWSTPVVLVHGDLGVSAGIHQASTPVIVVNGRIYTGFEIGAMKVQTDKAHGISLLSAPADADLLDKASWEHTPLAYLDRKDVGIPEAIEQAPFITTIEGNAVAGPDGEIYNMVRIDPVYVRGAAENKAALFKLKSFDEPLEFVRIVETHAGIRHKFYIQKDEKTGLYFMIGNVDRLGPCWKRRCLFTLSVSEDLVNWRHLKDILDCTHLEKHGISYPSFIIDGDDILYVSRTSYGKFNNEHDNNMVTFHRIENFRDLL